MLDINFIKENKNLVSEGAKKKGYMVDIDRLLEIDAKRRELLAKIDEVNKERNKQADLIKDGRPSETQIENGKQLKINLAELEGQLNGILVEYDHLMLSVPQVPASDVPDGRNDSDNIELRKVGEITSFDFEAKDHIELMNKLDMIDLERGVKVAGFRGYFLKNEAVTLSFALWQLSMKLLSEKGYKPIIAPSLIKELGLLGTGWLPHGAGEVYHVGDDDFLVGTAEASVMAMHASEVLDEAVLPLKYVAFSPCFRSEAGSYGKDTKGIVRVHEFFKIEQVILAPANKELSAELHDEITANAEELVKMLELPYRVVTNCAGDLGLGQVKKLDIETWLPSQKRYVETHSSSFFYDFQTRRLKIKYRSKSGESLFAYSLNNTALATPRILASLLENHQKSDGSIYLPQALHPFFNGSEKISKHE